MRIGNTITGVVAIAVALMAVIGAPTTGRAALVVDAVASGTGNGAYSGDVITGDLLSGLTGTASALRGGTLAALTDDAYGANNTGNLNDNTWFDSGATLTFDLNLAGAPDGFDITSIQAIFEWDANFPDHVYNVLVSPSQGVEDFVLLTAVSEDLTGAASKVVITDSGGVLASGVKAIRFAFQNNGNHQNTTLWRELDVEGTATVGGGGPTVDWSAEGVSSTNFGAGSADVYATVNTNLDNVVLVWHTSDPGTGSTNLWPNRTSLGPESAGLVTGQVTGLTSPNTYICRFYGSNTTEGITGWSGPITVQFQSLVQTTVSSATELAYAGDVSSSDLLHGLTATTTGWQLDAEADPQEIHDGVHGNTFNDPPSDRVQGGWTTVGATAEYNLGLGSGAGWDITNIQSIAAWNGAGFGNQGWTLEVKLKDAGSYTTLATVDYQPLGGAAAGATKVTLTDGTGVLASGVEYIKVTANSVNGGENAGAFVWRELDVFGVETGGGPTPAVALDGSTTTGSVASNAAPGTLVGMLSMVNTNSAGFSYTLDPSGGYTYFAIPTGTTNLRTAAWIDAASYSISIVGTKGSFSVTNPFTINITPDAADFLAFEVAAEMSAAPVAGTEQVGVLKARDAHTSGVGFSITGGRDDLFTISGGTNLMQVATTDPGAVGTINYVEVTATNAVATNALLIAVEVVSGTPEGTLFMFR